LAGDDFWLPVIPHVAAIVQAVPAALTRTSQERAAAIDATAVSKLDFAEKFLETTKTHTADPQNSHDPSVNIHTREVLEIIRDQNTIDTQKALADAKSYINGAVADENKRKKALGGLDAVSFGSRNDTIGDTDTNVFTYVWGRSCIPANSAKRALIQEAIVNALVDMKDTDTSQVCIGGRCARLIEALTLLDHDPKVSEGSATVEMYKNEIMSGAAKIIDDL